MDSHLIQTYRYKLQSRYRRVKSSEAQVIHWRLCQFWEFLNLNPIFGDILSILDKEYVLEAENNAEFKAEVEGIIDDSLQPDKYIGYENEKQGVLASYKIVKSCIEREVIIGNRQREITIGKRFFYHQISDSEDDKNAFIDNFVETLYEYIDEQLDDQNSLLYLLLKYKHVAEWFDKKTLLELWKSNTQSGEVYLANELYRFLYTQGLEFHVEPKGVVGRIDMISEQVRDERLLVDAKFSIKTHRL